MTDEITEHVRPARMELFCAKALDEPEQGLIARHLSECSNCERQLVDTLSRQKGTTHVSFTLSSEFWLRHEHLAYEQLVEFTDDKLDAPDRELIDVHLKTCAPCREDVQSFFAFRKQIAPEMEVSYAPVVLKPAPAKLTRWNPLRGLAWKPIYAAAIVLLGIAIIVAALYLKRRADNFQAQQTPTPSANPGAPSQTPTPSGRATNDPQGHPKESPAEKPNSAAAVVTLNDRGGMVTVDAGGKVSGLDDVATSTRDEIAEVLLSERIARPNILKELRGEDSNLRGSDNKQSFRLISPARSVLLSDRPTFKWEKLSGASAYRVYVNDREGNAVATSEGLSSDHNDWTMPKPLKRGEIYVWTVVAVVDGKEVVSPGPSLPEMKFQVLSASSLKRLNEIKKTRSHLALGVFYAKAGLFTDAEREFQELVRLNSKSKEARNLLHAVQRLLKAQR